jgi:hypothetical protein
MSCIVGGSLPVLPDQFIIIIIIIIIMLPIKP